MESDGQLSDEDQTFTSKGIFREETLYYDLGYRFAQLRDRSPQKILDLDLTGYIFIISLVLQFAFNVQQIFTLAVLVLFFGYSSFISTSEYKSSSIVVLGLVFFANVLDQISGGIFITPGLIVTDKLSAGVWILELAWILLFSTQIIITLQPVTPVFQKGTSVQPETPKAKHDYDLLKFRTRGSDFEIEEVKTTLDVELLRENLVYLLRMIGAVVGAGLLIDFIIWTIVGSFGGGTNVSEQYFISGLILVLFLFIYFSTGMLFSDPKKDDDPNSIDSESQLVLNEVDN